MNDLLAAKLKNLPMTSGVYLYKNNFGNIIYVGKAKVLKNRVSSYFQNNLKLGTKTQALVSRIADLETISTMSEIEALILEAELIKKHRPKYNVALKDDKSYLYIAFRNDVILRDNASIKIPKVLTARKTDLQKGDVTFGPYPSGNDARTIIKILRKIFPFRDCSLSKFNRYSKVRKSCLYGHIGLCQAPCLLSTNIQKYKKDISQLQKFLKGEGVKLISEYEHKMNEASKVQAYEEAARYRDFVKKLQYVRENYKTANQYIDNPNLMEDMANASLDELQKSITVIKSRPLRIECYDISNISGKEAVGSMVVATNGMIDKREYKRFRVKTKSSPDDFYMLKEVLTRRLRHSLGDKKVREWPKPDLILIDGGKGQISAVSEVMSELQCNIPMIGLAKKLETIVIKKESGFEELLLPKRNEGLMLLMRLRDESHRFAQSYHHLLRLKKISSSLTKN